MIPYIIIVATYFLCEIDLLNYILVSSLNNNCQELTREMTTAYERSVLLTTAALSLFCIFGVCTGQLNLDLRRMGQDLNTITLTCSDIVIFVPVQNALFYMRAPGTNRRRLLVDGNSGLVDFTRNGGAIMFTITPETEGTFTCASSPTREDETSSLLLAGGKIFISFCVNIIYNLSIFSVQPSETTVFVFHHELRMY